MAENLLAACLCFSLRFAKQGKFVLQLGFHFGMTGWTQGDQILEFVRLHIGLETAKGNLVVDIQLALQFLFVHPTNLAGEAVSLPGLSGP